LKKLKELVNAPIIVYDKSGKRSEKKISYLMYRNSKNMITLRFKAESGLPIKRFVNSDGVSPGISTILNTSCVCQEFDFYDIEV
jgi:tRNA pseudouridine synthase 10